MGGADLEKSSDSVSRNAPVLVRNQEFQVNVASYNAGRLGEGERSKCPSGREFQNRLGRR